jgi:tetratricopeptide (TPR) repeat protein
MQKKAMQLTMVGWFVAACALNQVCCAVAATPANDPKLVEARRLWLRGRYGEAEAAARELLPATPHAVVILSRTLNETGRRGDAIDALRAAAKASDEKAVYVQAELALLLLEIGEYDDALHSAEQAAVDGKLLPAAEWVSAELHRVHGRLKQAESGYGRLLERLRGNEPELDVETLLWVARAAIQQARWGGPSGRYETVVRRLLPRIHRQEKTFWPARLFAAQLYAEKFNPAQADAEIDLVLATNPNAAGAHALRGQMAVGRFDSHRAGAALAPLRRTNPGSAVANCLQAELALQRWRYAEAVALLDESKQENPHDERMLGVLAAAMWGRAGLHEPAPADVLKLVQKVEDLNPHCAVFYESLASQVDGMRKFPFAVELFEEAIRRQPNRIGVRGRLGLLLMRLGREKEAEALLTKSFENDPFNVRVKNMLEVIDVIKGYATLETEHFVIRFDRGPDGVLAEQAARYLEQDVYPQLTKKLQFEPPGKTLIEIFNNARNSSGHNWFSARMVGLPFVGTVGACAGKMVAITSPNGIKKKFNWARVLRHEFVHVVNLQQTNFHIPHWFTESLAVRLEDAPRPAEWDEILARRHASSSLFTLANINSGFIRPKSSDDWTLAYCQSNLYSDFFVERYGDQSLSKLLAAYADNQSTEQAVESALGVSLKTVERGYAEFIDEIVKGVHLKQQLETPIGDLQRLADENPDDADAQAELALALLKRNRKPAARRSALAALELQPAQPLAEFVMARLELSIGDRESALARLERAYDSESPEEDVLLLLAAFKLQDGQFDRAASIMAVGAKAFPHPTRWLKQLARVHLKAKNDKALYPVLARLADAEGDSLLYRQKLIQMADKAKNYDDVVKWANQSLQIDVMDAGHHAQLGLALLELGKSADAVRALQTAIQLDPNTPSWRFGLARAAKTNGDHKLARTVLAKLAEESPDYPGAKELLKELKHDR